MTIVSSDCPHCFTKHIALLLVAASNLHSGNEIAASLVCPKCKMPISARLEKINPMSSARDAHELNSFNTDIKELNWRIAETWPTIPLPSIPEFIPPDVARVLLQGESNFTTEGNEEAAGMMYRKALDIGLKKIDPQLTGMLGSRIKKLKDAGKLTNDIAEWADSIKDTGNEAAHEEAPISREELKELRSFTDMVLRYLFTLPNMVKKRRGQKLEWDYESE
jgi:hypothetical protein